MKKFYSFVLASVIALAANAQQLQKSADRPVFTYNPATQTIGPKKAQKLVDGAISWGYINYNDLNSDGINLVGYGSAGTYCVGIKVPANETLKGSKIVAVDVPIYTTGVMSGNYTVTIVSSTGTVATKSVSPSTLTDYELNSIVLDEPVTIDSDLIVYTGYTTTGSTQPATYPILYESTVQAAGSLLLAESPTFTDYTDYGTQFGAYCAKIQVTGVTMDDANVRFTSMEGYTNPDSDVTLKFELESNSGKAVESIEYTISVNGGEAETRTANIAIGNGFSKFATLDVKFHTPSTIGTYDVVLNVTKVNGGTNSGAGELTCKMHNLSHFVNRNVVMEEFTGTGCGFCPRGWAGMLKCNETFGDQFIGIALHQYNSSDPMYIAPANYPLSYGGAPSSYIDRAGDEVDPGYSTASDAWAARQNVVAPVAVNVKATWTNADKTNVDVTAEVEALAEGSYELVYVLTADGLTGTSFKQSNYYYQYTVAQGGDGTELDKFCKGGEYGSSSVQLVYDDVAIATSYTSSKNNGGMITLGADEKGTKEYGLKMPTKTALLTAIKNADYDVYAVVIALLPDGTVANAGKVKVQYPDAVDVIESSNTQDAAIYSISGQRLSKTQKGLNIVNGKKFFVK